MNVTIICSNTGNQAAAGSKALELGGKLVSERGCLPTKLTDTYLDACLVPYRSNTILQGRLLPQWLSQDVMTKDRTRDPPSRRQRLRPFSHSDLLSFEVL